MIVFLLILHFLLAIIVEAYMKLREGTDAHQTEGEFFTDVYHILDSTCRRTLFGWPEPARLGEVVETWRAKISVGYLGLLGTGLFRSPEACVSFLKFYSSFDFMHPPAVVKYGKNKRNKADERPLKEILTGCIVEVTQRRETQGRITEAEKLRLKLLPTAAKYSTHDVKGYQSRTSSNRDKGSESLDSFA
jgi:hypothetical protein